MFAIFVNVRQIMSICHGAQNDNESNEISNSTIKIVIAQTVRTAVAFFFG
jgi:hypothetical protein